MSVKKIPMIRSGENITHIPPEQLGFDIDGVVADTLGAFIRIARDEHAISIVPGQVTDFMVENCLDISSGIIERIFSRLLLEPVAAGLQPMAAATQVLKEISRRGPVSMITARPDFDPIAEWLEYHLGSRVFMKIRLIATGDHDGKAAHIRALGLTHFIDDRLQTCLALAEEDGITPVIYDQPWNRGHCLPKVCNWGEIRALCFA